GDEACGGCGGGGGVGGGEAWVGFVVGGQVRTGAGGEPVRAERRIGSAVAVGASRHGAAERDERPRSRSGRGRARNRRTAEDDQAAGRLPPQGHVHALTLASERDRGGEGSRNRKARP